MSFLNNFVLTVTLINLIGVSICSFPEDNVQDVRLMDDELLIDGDVLVKKSNSTRAMKITVPRDHQLWPQKTLVYQISPQFNSQRRNNIIQATNILSRRTNCLRFKQRTSESDYVNIVFEG